MACALSANGCSTITSSVSPTRRLFLNKYPKRKASLSFLQIRASAADEAEDCNVEECAPDKEVGKVSMEWLAGEKTKVRGTFPPRKQGWTGYVEKDTAGQTNIYSIEPAVYVAESAISSGNAGSSADGADNNAAVAAGLALISIAAASSVILQVGKTTPPTQRLEYSGPSLSYYINKFKPPEIVQAAVPVETSAQPESSAVEVSEIQDESENQPDASTSNSNTS